MACLFEMGSEKWLLVGMKTIMDFSKHLKTIFGLGSPYFSSKNVFSLSLSLFFSSKNLSLKDYFFSKIVLLLSNTKVGYIYRSKPAWRPRKIGVHTKYFSLQLENLVVK